jgi:protein O-GlcNAc transferase
MKRARSPEFAAGAKGGAALPLERQSIAAGGKTAAQWLAEGLAAQQSQNWALATACFEQTLSAEPDNAAALYSLAAVKANLGQADQALPLIDRVIALKPAFAQAILARSSILQHLNQISRALADVELAIQLEPGLPGAAEQRQRLAALHAAKPVSPARAAADNLAQQALSFQAAGNLAEARAHFERALHIEPLHFAALYSLGVITSQEGQSEEALGFMTRATQAEPGNAQGHFALGTLLQGRALYEAALASFDQALSLNPSYIEAYNNKATLLHSMGRQKDSLLTTEAGLSVAPNDHKLLGNKGYILTEFKLHSTAAHVFRRLLDLNPDYDYAEGLHAYARLHSCDWTDYEDNRARIIDGVRAGRRVCNPLAFMALSDDAHDARRCAEIFAAHRFPAAKEPLYRGETYRHRRRRVAFLSADFREHPVGYLLIGLIEHFDRKQFETYGISFGIRDGSDLYRRYRNGFDHYLDCEDKTSIEIARLMRAMEIDIAIDLSGYTSGSRLDILSHRPAPIQMTYLGFPGGLGTDYIDYIIADRVTIPEELQSAYKEKVLYLPGCYLPRDTSVKPADSAPPKEHFGLPSKGTVFCSFNHDYKINPPMFSVWMDLLRETPGSVLWLMKLNEDAERNLLESARNLDVDPKRLVFATRVPRVEDHLARYRHADVFLDTYPYNGHTTASDALYAGVPVVTMSGTSFASRVAGSLIAFECQNGFMTSNVSDYKECVFRVIEDPCSVTKRKTQCSPTAETSDYLATLLSGTL